MVFKSLIQTTVSKYFRKLTNKIPHNRTIPRKFKTCQNMNILECMQKSIGQKEKSKEILEHFIEINRNKYKEHK